MSVDHASAVAAPKSDPVFLHVKPGMTVIFTDKEGAWRMADVIWVDGGARNSKVQTLFQVAHVDTRESMGRAPEVSVSDQRNHERISRPSFQKHSQWIIFATAAYFLLTRFTRLLSKIL